MGYDFKKRQIYHSSSKKTMNEEDGESVWLSRNVSNDFSNLDKETWAVKMPIGVALSLLIHIWKAAIKDWFWLCRCTGLSHCMNFMLGSFKSDHKQNFSCEGTNTAVADTAPVCVLCSNEHLSRRIYFAEEEVTKRNMHSAVS